MEIIERCKVANIKNIFDIKKLLCDSVNYLVYIYLEIHYKVSNDKNVGNFRFITAEVLWLITEMLDQRNIMRLACTSTDMRNFVRLWLNHHADVPAECPEVQPIPADIYKTIFLRDYQMDIHKSVTKVHNNNFYAIIPGGGIFRVIRYEDMIISFGASELVAANIAGPNFSFRAHNKINIFRDSDCNGRIKHHGTIYNMHREKYVMFMSNPPNRPYDSILKLKFNVSAVDLHDIFLKIKRVRNLNPVKADAATLSAIRES